MRRLACRPASTIIRSAVPTPHPPPLGPSLRYLPAGRFHRLLVSRAATRVPLTEEHQGLAERLSVWLSETYDAIDYGTVFEKVEDAVGSLPALDDASEEVTYGEFSLPLLCALLDALDPPENATFIDIGSGRGQLCLTAAAVREWKACIGVEVLPELHFMSVAAYEVARTQRMSGSVVDSPLSRCSFVLGDMYTALGELKSDVEASGGCVAFLYATKFQTLPPPEDDILLLSPSLGAALPVGSTVVTINKKLDERDGFELRSHQVGPNPEGGDVQVYVYDLA